MKEDEIELQEALDVGDEALDHLQKAKAYLKKAGGWGIADIVGGALLTTHLKRSNMAKAQEEIENASASLRSYSTELRDLDINFSIDFLDDGFMGFADYFLDNAFVDILAQQKITEMKRQVEQAISAVERIQDQLMELMDRITQH